MQTLIVVILKKISLNVKYGFKELDKESIRLCGKIQYTISRKRTRKLRRDVFYNFRSLGKVMQPLEEQQKAGEFAV